MRKFLIFLPVLFLLFYFLLNKKVINVAPWELKNDQGRTNILLLGIGDAGHDGPNLTDTMMVASIKPASPSAVFLISVPRDIYLDSLNGKINSAYGQNLNAAQTAVTEVTGLPIHYSVRVDFSAFEKIIDILGGIDINVERTFDDYDYPVDQKETDSCNGDPEFRCRYRHLHFDAGPQHLDGATALKFVRSRHAEGEEGTDFARGKRQQLVIKAVQAKIFSNATFLNPGKLLSVYNELKSHIDTNFDLSHPDELLKLALKYKNARIKNIFLDTNFLDNPPEDSRGWILLPKTGSWDEVHKFIKGQLQ
ncbi:LCP family protein [Candidatus Gottesmanbacteria bacterium]|nr:LCP family protein [Candidatus Gottesmanbacteria bacterium]